MAQKGLFCRWWWWWWCNEPWGLVERESSWPPECLSFKKERTPWSQRLKDRLMGLTWQRCPAFSHICPRNLHLKHTAAINNALYWQ
jgi:hypothetical protein